MSVKKAISGRIYWVDLEKFRKPEWGNSSSENPHLYILIKTDNFENKEMFLSFPLTTNKVYEKIYLKNIVKGFYLNNKPHYVLLNHVRTISKERILDGYNYYETENILFLNGKKIMILKINYTNYINNKFISAIKSYESRIIDNSD